MSTTTTAETPDGVSDDADPPPYYTTPNTSNSTAFHSAKDCERIIAPEKVVERPVRYIRWHDLSPCPWCHDAFEPPNPAQGTSIAKSIRYSDAADDATEADADGPWTVHCRDCDWTHEYPTKDQAASSIGGHKTGDCAGDVSLRMADGTEVRDGDA